MSRDILIVEDDKEMQGFYKEMLKDEEYNLTIASNGQEGVKRIKDEKFDLVILDIVMEEPTGDRLFALLRKSPLYKEVPVIFVSVFKKETYSCTKALGHVSFLEKPFVKEDLLEEIRKSIGQCT
ncbi:MAG: response regulator [Candidatus Brocadiales bacterium]